MTPACPSLGALDRSASGHLDGARVAFARSLCWRASRVSARVMTIGIPLDDVLKRPVELTHAEAVAIAQELIACPDGSADITAAPGPPALATVYLQPDGSAVCATCHTTPAVSEIAALLDQMLPHGTSTRVPGALRYTIARGLLEVDAPPFDSLADFSRALARHEQDDRNAILRDLYNRATRPAPEPVAAERRRSGPSASELRRRLREADEALFERTAASDPVLRRAAPVSIPDPPRRPRAANTTARAAVLAVLLIAGGVGYALVGRERASRTAAPLTAAVVPPGREVAARKSAVVPAAPATQESADVPAPPAVAPVVPRVPRPAHRAVREVRPERADRVLPASAGPAFSPSFALDGTAMFFQTGRSADARSALEAKDLLHADLGVMTILDDGAKNYHAQPSPDGTHVAFDSDRDGERGVYLANRDGTGVRRVSGPGYAAVPTWSPDGKTLAFIRGEQADSRVWNLWLLTLATGQDRRLTSFRSGQVWNASWFPDGRRVCYTHEDRIIVRDLETGATAEYASPVAGRLTRTPAVSPDGRYVIFEVAHSGAWLLDLGDGSSRCVLQDPTAEEFAWSPDGRRVAFHSRRDGHWGVWIMAPS
jgi:hypothetical protein